MSCARFAFLAAAEGNATAAEALSRDADQAMATVGGSLSPWLANRLREISASVAMAR